MDGTTGNFSAGSAELERTAGELTAAADGIRADLRRLDGTVSAVARAWHGPAARTYRALQERWSRDADTLVRALTAMAETLRGTSRTYAETEAAQRQRLDGLRTALG